MIPFISRADLGDYMAQDLTSSDPALMAVDAACEAVRTFCRRRLNKTTDETITLDGSGTDTLLLPNWPVIGTPTVTEDDVAVTAFVVDGSLLRRNDWGYWSRGVGNIEVTYSHGYAVSEVDVDGAERMPADLRMVALQIAAGLMSAAETRFHAQAERDTVGGSDPEEGPVPASLTSEQMGILMAYRNPRVA
jgi:hypothetical protein